MTDAKLITDLGGPTKVAELLGYGKDHGGVQRVQNWLKRGIPAHVKVAYPELFLRSPNAPYEAWDGINRRFGPVDRRVKAVKPKTAKVA